jgi:hypothetical protein
MENIYEALRQNADELLESMWELNLPQQAEIAQYITAVVKERIFKQQETLNESLELLDSDG